jgi:Ni,Fe-hydrogenase III small subunit
LLFRDLSRKSPSGGVKPPLTKAATGRLTPNVSPKNQVQRMPEEKIVVAANEIALKPRVFSSKRNFKYSGTERALEP